MEIESTAQLDWALQPMLDRLEKFLRARQSGIQALQITLKHRELPSTKIRLRFLSPAGSYKDLALLLNERLARTELVAPALGAQIRSSSLWVMQEENAGLFRQKQLRSADLSRLLERLRVRLGDEAVYGVEIVADHRPEAAWKKNVDLLDRKSHTHAESAVLPRPAWLLNLPLLLEVENARPIYQGKLQIEQGPERIETGWWDGQGIARDYYIALTEQFRRVWIFRERHPPGRWFLHGFFG
jgi:protein ImuB